VHIFPAVDRRLNSGDEMTRFRLLRTAVLRLAATGLLSLAAAAGDPLKDDPIVERYNRQFGNAVIGLESDFSFTSFSAQDYLYSGEVDIRISWNWFSTIRARLGYTSGNAMFYVTGETVFVNLKAGIALNRHF
jgi:hypothetical protein